MQADPPLRADGKCANCKKTRRHAVWNRYSDVQAILDPFCSTECCRSWHSRPHRPPPPKPPVEGFTE